MDSFDFVTPINSGISKLCEILENDTDTHQLPDREKIIDLASFLETQILALKAKYEELLRFLDSRFSLCKFVKMIAQLEYQPRKILENDSLSEIQNLIGKCQEVEEYFYPILNGFYRFCKKNAFYETSKLLLCASVRKHSTTATESTEETQERLLILLESEFSLVIHICLFWTTIQHQGSEIDVKMQECDKRLAKSLCDNNSMMLNNRSAGKGFELIECPSQITNYQEAEVLSKVMLEFMEKIAKQSETCNIQTSAHYLEANKTFLGIERLEDKKEFVKGLSCKMLATFCEDLETKCQLLRQSQNHFLRLNHILDKDFSYVIQCFIDENYGLIWKLLHNFSLTIQDGKDRDIIETELNEVAKERIRFGEELIRTTNFNGSESQLFTILLNLIECSDSVFHGRNIHIYIAKFVEMLRHSAAFAEIFQQRIGIDIKNLPDETLIEIVLNIAQIDRGD